MGRKIVAVERRLFVEMRRTRGWAASAYNVAPHSGRGARKADVSTRAGAQRLTSDAQTSCALRTHAVYGNRGQAKHAHVVQTPPLSRSKYDATQREQATTRADKLRPTPPPRLRVGAATATVASPSECPSCRAQMDRQRVSIRPRRLPARRTRNSMNSREQRRCRGISHPTSHLLRRRPHLPR
jgi:hypothetical protein